MKRIKMGATALLAMVMTLIMSVTVMANTPAPNLAESLGEGMTGIVSQILGILVVILPIGLGLLGTFIALRAGINLIRRLSRG